MKATISLFIGLAFSSSVGFAKSSLNDAFLNALSESETQKAKAQVALSVNKESHLASFKQNGQHKKPIVVETSYFAASAKEANYGAGQKFDRTLDAESVLKRDLTKIK